MSSIKKPTQRSRLLGLYLQFKALCWFSLGIALAWGFVVAGDLGTRDGIRAFAYFTVAFLVPGLLLWILGIAVKVRHRTCWWFAMAYFVAIVVAKATVGATDLPWESWSWVSVRLPPFYLRGFELFAVFMTAVMAADVAALASFVSPQGRACFGVGKIHRTDLEEVRREDG